MTDVRARLADAIENHRLVWGDDCSCGEEFGSVVDQELHLVDILLSLPGIAIVEVPAPLPGRVEGELPTWEVTPTVVQADHYGRVLLDADIFEPAEARALAARLLAAANAAGSKHSGQG